jgi:phospholipase C
VVIGALAVVALLALPFPDGAVLVGSTGPALGADYLPFQFRSDIKHIVVVMMENHAYDNYFATYCTARSTYCSHIANGEPPSLCIPINPNNTKGGCIKPFPFTPANWTLTSKLPHSFTSGNTAWQNGSMDGFYYAEKSGLDPFGYYDGNTAPFYWDLAEEYGLGDEFFSSTLTYSLPNHWHLVAGTAPAESVNHLFGVIAPANRRGNDSLYLNESNHTRSAEDLLHNTTISWDYYDHGLPSYNRSIQDTNTTLGGAYAYWNPQAAKAESYTKAFNHHFVDNTQFYGDAANGTLPQLSWLIPSISESDHPPDNVTVAESWMASVVDAVEASPDWNTTAMFIVWDDYGGFYDHVAPRYLAGSQTNNLTGFRVPMIVVSPYAKLNYVSHTFGYFESILHLMEWRFHLGCLSPVDCGAPLPFDYFDFNQKPRAPILFSTNASNWSYPMPLQSPAAALPGPAGTYSPPADILNLTGAAAGEDVD